MKVVVKKSFKFVLPGNIYPTEFQASEIPIDLDDEVADVVIDQGLCVLYKGKPKKEQEPEPKNK